jgi:hypothetical protein
MGMASGRPCQPIPDTFVPGRLTDSRSEELMNDGSAPVYLRSETTLRQPWQRNIRSAGCGPELRWSVKCFICAPQPLQMRMGTSCELVAVSVMPDKWQISRIAAVQFETFSEKTRQGRYLPLPTARSDGGRGHHGPGATARAAFGAANYLEARRLPLGAHRINPLGLSLVDRLQAGLNGRISKARGAGCHPCHGSARAHTANAQRSRGNRNSSNNIIRTHKHRSKNKRELAFGATIDDAQH